MAEPGQPVHAGRLLSVQTGRAAPLQAGGRRILSAIGKRPVTGPVTVQAMGLAGDEQADLSVHGGLDKAVYAYPHEHYGFWQAQRQAHGVSLFDEALPPGFVGENLSLLGLLEHQVFVGDTLHFADCVLRVTAPREPCFKFNAVMGFNTAARLMATQARCGFYLAVAQPSTLVAGEPFTVVAGRRALSIQQAIMGKLAKHLR